IGIARLYLDRHRVKPFSDHPAIDVPHRAVDVAGGIRRQEGDNVLDLRGVARTAEGCPAGSGLLARLPARSRARHGANWPSGRARLHSRVSRAAPARARGTW